MNHSPKTLFESNTTAGEKSSRQYGNTKANIKNKNIHSIDWEKKANSHVLFFFVYLFPSLKLKIATGVTVLCVCLILSKRIKYSSRDPHPECPVILTMFPSSV